MPPRSATGTLALLGRRRVAGAVPRLDRALLALAGSDEVLVLPAAAAFEHPGRVVERATEWFAGLGAQRRALDVVNRRDAETDERRPRESHARPGFIYVADGSPLHLRSVLKGSALYDAMVHAYTDGAVLAASGAGATVAVRSDGRSARRGVHGRARPRPRAGGVPVPRPGRRSPAGAIGRAAAGRGRARRSRRAHRARSRRGGRLATSTDPARRPSTARAARATLCASASTSTSPRRPHVR